MRLHLLRKLSEGIERRNAELTASTYHLWRPKRRPRHADRDAPMPQLAHVDTPIGFMEAMCGCSHSCNELYDVPFGIYTGCACPTMYGACLDMHRHPCGCQPPMLGSLLVEYYEQAYYWKLPLDPLVARERDIAERMLHDRPVFLTWGSHLHPPVMLGERIAGHNVLRFILQRSMYHHPLDGRGCQRWGVPPDDLTVDKHARQGGAHGGSEKRSRAALAFPDAEPDWSEWNTGNASPTQIAAMIERNKKRTTYMTDAERELEEAARLEGKRRMQRSQREVMAHTDAFIHLLRAEPMPPEPLGYGIIEDGYVMLPLHLKSVGLGGVLPAETYTRLAKRAMDAMERV